MKVISTSLLLLLFSILLFPKLMLGQSPDIGNKSAFPTLVWSDEFNGTGMPDTVKWGYEKGYIRNKELQYYTDKRPENISIENGSLRITARHDSLRIGDAVYPITSAGINTYRKQSWTYGRIEVRAKVPSSLGTWPAIWTLGDDRSTAGWPACGEIDILEHVGYLPDVVHFNAHTRKYNHVKKTGKGIQVPLTSPHADFHVNAIEWFKDRIDWYLDGKKVFTYKNEGTGKDAWPFDEPQYLIINLAFGGAWGGSRGVDISSLPQTFLIDYVRVYR